MTTSLIGNQIVLTENGQTFRTLKDLVPATGVLRVLVVAKTPASVSVDAGHYFQGTQGRMFWNRLKDHRLLNWRTLGKEDDDLLPNGWGLTDIVKRPRDYTDEPSPDEYRAGAPRIKGLIESYRPKVILFVYKRVLDQLLQHAFGMRPEIYVRHERLG